MIREFATAPVALFRAQWPTALGSAAQNGQPVFLTGAVGSTFPLNSHRAPSDFLVTMSACIRFQSLQCTSGKVSPWRKSDSRWKCHGPLFDLSCMLVCDPAHTGVSCCIQFVGNGWHVPYPKCLGPDCSRLQCILDFGELGYTWPGDHPSKSGLLQNLTIWVISSL